jgi:hypothetical protein
MSQCTKNIKNMDYLDQELTRAGLTKGDLTWLNENQKWLLTEPTSGPENFYCDGELNHTQALANWERKMKNAGIPQRFITKAQKTFL